MLTDQRTIFTDHKKVQGTVTSEVVELAPFSGKGAQPVYVSVAIKEPHGSGATLGITVEESDDSTNWSSVQTITAPAEQVEQGGYFYFALPSKLKKKYVRLKYNASGSGGILFAGITVEVLDTYEKGLYMAKGSVVK